LIVLRRLGGELIALNPDLIERVEATPDTVVTLLDDKKFLIEESLDDVLRLITDYRAYVIARSRELVVSDYDPGGRPVLHVVPDELVASRAAAEPDPDPNVVRAVQGRFGRSGGSPDDGDASGDGEAHGDRGGVYG
jgi:flagellar protein FlbD